MSLQEIEEAAMETPNTVRKVALFVRGKIARNAGSLQEL